MPNSSFCGGLASWRENKIGLRVLISRKITNFVETLRCMPAWGGAKRKTLFIENKKIMAKVYEFLANGFEEVEGLAPVDILRRGGVDIKTVSITGSEYVETSHGVTLKADLKIENADLSDADMILLPGGLPGATNLRDHEGVRAALTAQAARGGRIGAICAAPLVLGSLGLLEGKNATCYPGFEKFMTGANYTHELFTIDGNIITGEGPAATFPYSYEILRMFTSDDTVASLQKGMMYCHLMQKA